MSSVFNISTSGIVDCQGAIFPSVDGVQTVIDYNGSETIIFQMTGAVTPTFDFPVTFSRTGKNVVMAWDGFQKTRTGTDILFTADLVPERFRPTIISGNPPVWLISIIDGSSLISPASFSAGVISFGDMGNITIGRLDQTNFTNAYVGAFGSHISYYVP